MAGRLKKPSPRAFCVFLLSVFLKNGGVCMLCRGKFFLLFFHLGVDITESILMFYSMTITNNKSQYSVITTESDDQGNDRYYVEFFLKSRKGLNDAYKYAFKQPNWKIYFGGEVVDSSESFDPNQVDGDYNTLCTQ